MGELYEELAPYYHLIFQDWSASIARQAGQLSQIIAARWPKPGRVLDVACGIGTQALGLAALGYRVVGSDLSAGAVARARQEAQRRGLSIELSVCDMRDAHRHHGNGFRVILCCDNSLPHLLTDRDLLTALRQFFACLAMGGGCVISVRDYALEPRGQNLVKPYGVCIEGGSRYLMFQVWDFDGEYYDLKFFVVEENLATGAAVTRVMRSRYYAVSTDKLCELMRQAGFGNVARLDDVFYQPVLVGTKLEAG